MANYQSRFGKIMSYLSDDGVEHSESFWYVDQFSFHISARQLQFVAIAHHDTAAYDAGRAPIAGAVHLYNYVGDEFDALIARHPELVYLLMQEMWSEARLKKDVGESPAEGEEDTRESFFEGAIDAQ